MTREARIARIIVAYFAACGVASVGFGLWSLLSVLLTSTSLTGRGSSELALFAMTPLIVFPYVTALTIIPSAAFVVWAEFRKVRALWAYALAGAAIGFFVINVINCVLYIARISQTWAILPWGVMINGLLAGAIYWLIAGRNAGDLHPSETLASSGESV